MLKRLLVSSFLVQAFAWFEVNTGKLRRLELAQLALMQQLDGVIEPLLAPVADGQQVLCLIAVGKSLQRNAKDFPAGTQVVP